jgi:hypothetical protein
VREEVFHEACVVVFDECFFYICYLFVVKGLELSAPNQSLPVLEEITTTA